MKCFLHIGTEKTATTTLQNFLDLNRNELLKNDFVYTKSAGKINNRKLCVAAYNLTRRDDFTKRNGIYSNSELSAFNNRTIIELKEEIKEVADRDSDLKIIFSSEHFQSRLTKVEEIKRLKEILYSLGVNDVSVIVYLRDPAKIANSLFSTAVKAGNLGELPPPPSSPYYANICNHRNTLEKFGSVFGEHSLIPKIFYKTAFINGSIIDDFLKAIGAPLDRAYNIPGNANESLSMEGINILKRINKIIPTFIDNKPNPIRANIASYIAKHFSDIKYIMPRELFEQYELEFHESNEWVRKKYFPDRQSLFPKISYPDETKSNIPDGEIDKFSNLIANIWTDKQSRIISLTSQLPQVTRGGGIR